MDKLAKSGKKFCIRFIGSNGKIFYPLIFSYFLPIILLNSSPATGSANISAVFESVVFLTVGNIVEDLDGDGVEDLFDEDDDGDGFSDVFEIAYPSDPNDPDSLATQYPYDLEAVNDLVMIAGQPHGTVIGKFAAREPDGEVVTFSLGSNTDGLLLQIDPKGYLMVGTDSSAGQTGVVEIIVKASDPWGASVEKQFEVMVFEDAYEAISGYLPLEESVEVGTAIGSFATVEEGNGSVQSFEQALVGGRGDSAFEIGADGLLKVAQPLDYETLSTYYVGVRVTDEDGGMRVQYFGINLINESAPILEALEPTVQSSSMITLRGSILDPGCVAGVTEVGFLISEKPILGMEQDGVQKLTAVSGETADSFESSYEITGGGKIYFRAYGINGEGLSMSLEETYLPNLDFHPHAILNAVSKGDGSEWWESPWFGDIYGDPENGWVYHSAHGWIFPIPSPTTGIWLWFEDFGWLWTTPDIHPFLFSDKKANWLFIGLESPEQNLFFDYENKNWFSRSRLTTNPKQ